MKSISIFPLLLLIAGITRGQIAPPAFVRDSLESYINRALQAWELPGVSVAIVKDGQIVLSKGYGVKEVGKNDPVDENTLFMIGSNTKAMTATAIALLHVRKKLSLDDKVVKWLPDFKLRDPWVTKELQIADLLSHRIGMETFQGDFMYWTSALTSKEVLEKFGKLTPVYGFRSKWGYTNAAFLAAGEIIPRVTGKPWSLFLKDSLFIPLGMTRTLALSAELPNATNKAVPHTLDHEKKLVSIPYCRIDNLAPAGSVSSSAADMAKWVLMQLENGRMNGKEIIPASALAMTKTPYSILGNGGHPFNKSHFSLYGLGWFLEEYSGRKIVSHTGGVNGFVTSVTLIPEEKLGIIVLTNTDQNGFYEALKWEIIDAYLNLPYRNYSNFYLMNSRQQINNEKKTWKMKADTVAMKNKPALSLDSYTGRYRNEAYGNLQITTAGDALRLTFEHHPNLEGILQPLGNNRFFCTYSDPEFGKKVLSFSGDATRIKSLTVYVADFIEFTPYEFIKQ
ncbi:MAG TPA: serine hydrolase [Flavitalea sp.]|nr:serine hydrolase [Flavitalea sp.]